ncbi:MAG: HD-GYP domain-containing protein [Actinobacteria bacterium]|nr:HD-GYP domain-containing protein [Actinomycetota bacterium]MBO0835595.1 HD-GYP domain-containing protein [Actinomycetota bacterium]
MTAGQPGVSRSPAGTEREARITPAAWVYIIVVVLAAALLLAQTPLFGPSTGDTRVTGRWVALAVLQVLFLICDSARAPLTSRQTRWSPSSSATLAAAVLLGPGAAALVGATSVISLRRRVGVAERLFNGAMHVLAGLAAGSAYLAIHHDRVGMPQPEDVRIVLLAFAAAAVVHVLANYGLIWLIDQFNRGSTALRSEAPESSLALLLTSDLGYASLGLVIASLWSTMQWFAAVIVLVPLFVARWAMAQFAEEQRAYSATMNALCQAVETKDYYTRGHGDRVARGSVMIAGQIGMSSARTEAIRFAGMLHDVGKLGVPTQVLQKTGPLTEDEFAAIQLHPMRGLEIVREIGFLYEALNGIMHHHERIDGRGYPMGLAGHEIPEFARIIAVADAFDSMTSTRSYREAKTTEQAVAELRKGAGTQFDPLVVEAFIAALARTGWQRPVPASAPIDLATVTVQDHDDPTAPLQVIVP